MLFAAVPVALGADAGELREQAAGLQTRSGSLETRAQGATLELYALEAQLGRAQAELDAVQAQRAQLAREQASTRAQLTVAKQSVTVAQTRLAELVRALYQQPGHDPLAIVLGAKSLDEALTALDGISRAAGRANRIVAQARAARLRLEGLGAKLTQRAQALDALAFAAEARTEALAASAADRRQYVAGLRRQQGLNAARIASIEAQARAAETRTVELASTAATAAPPPPLAPVEVAAPLAARTSGPRTLTVTSTGYSIRGRTATGIPTGPGVVAVDPSVIPLGTKLTIPGYGVGVAADTGGAVQGNTIDVWFPTRAQALQWGRRTVTVTLH